MAGGAKIGSKNPLSEIVALLVVRGSSEAGTITDANLLFCDLVGWKQRELIGQPLDVLVPAESRVAHHLFRAGYMNRPTPRPMGIDRDVYLLHKDGHTMQVLVGLSSIDRDHVIAAVQAMSVGRSFGLPGRGTLPR